MPADIELREVDSVEITTVIDNFIEMLGLDDTEIVHRFVPSLQAEKRDWALAEHGFSAILQTAVAESRHSVMMDFGQSSIAVPFNLETLKVDLARIEGLVLSHGHIDHFGALVPVLRKMPATPIPLMLHPAAFAAPRYLKFPAGIRVDLPALERPLLEEAGAEIMASPNPRLFADDTVLFLGEIERTNDFEKGMPIAYFEQNGEEFKDDILDDSALVTNLRGKGLVILSGCAHAGIINTMTYAKKVTGIERIHVVMGGFHLLGPSSEPLVGRTLDEMKAFSPDYIVPCHCTGRKAMQAIETQMPAQFLLNQSGTRMVFA